MSGVVGRSHDELVVVHGCAAVSGSFFGVRVLLESTRDNGDGLWPVDRVPNAGEGVGDRDVADEGGQEERDTEEEGGNRRAESFSVFSGAREGIREQGDDEQTAKRDEERCPGADQFPDEPVFAGL